LNGNEKQRNDAQNFYPVDQPPVYVSFTAANSWPAGGVRQADYPKLRMRSRPPEWGAVEPSDCQLKTLIPDYRYQSRYDSATHDLFPFFRGDFRPLAEAWEEWAIARCRPKTSAATRVSSQGAGLIVRVLRNIPFMNTDVEQTRTIGHLAPMRPAFGTFAEINTAATTVGTTHEFVINQSTGHPTVYSNAADPRKSECAVVDGWIAAARASAGRRFGTRWDSSYTRKKRDPNVALNVTPVRDRRNYETMTVEKDGKAITKQVAVAGVDHLESQFRHGYVSSGISPIVASNDPFWNIRAFDTGLHDHNGYGFYPLICAIQQLVLDKVAGSSARVVPPPPITPTAPAPSPASAPIENRP
jgi:hypothetical protein